METTAWFSESSPFHSCVT